LNWYPKQTTTVDPLSLVNGSEDFVLNGIADYKEDGSNGDSLVILHLKVEGSQYDGWDYFIGYNRRVGEDDTDDASGINSGTGDKPDMVHILKTDKSIPGGTAGFGLSVRIAALNGQGSLRSYSWNIGNQEITLVVNSINGKNAYVTLRGGRASQIASPTASPTASPPRNCADFRFVMKFDGAAKTDETSWFLYKYRDGNSNKQLVTTANNDGNFYDNYLEELWTACLDYNTCWEVIVSDKGYNGIGEEGYYKITLGDTELIKGDEWSTREESNEFCVDSEGNANNVSTSQPTGSPTESPTQCADANTGKFRLSPNGRRRTCSSFANSNRCDQKITESSGRRKRNKRAKRSKSASKFVWQMCRKSCQICQ